jgi:drug/metabolite transporter (DMT)-like permease
MGHGRTLLDQRRPGDLVAVTMPTALIPLYVAILAAVVLGEVFTVAKRIGLVLIVTGVLGIVWGAPHLKAAPSGRKPTSSPGPKPRASRSLRPMPLLLVLPRAYRVEPS